MAILDAGPYQEWTRAFDRYDRAKRRSDAAGQMGIAALNDYLRADLDQSAYDLQQATRALKNLGK